MAKTRVQKDQDLAEVTNKLKSAKSVVFTDYRGSTVAQVDTLRRALAKEQISSKVYKITLLQKALAEQGLDASMIDHKVPLIASFSETDETAPARVIRGLLKDIPTLTIMSGILDHTIMSKAQVMALAQLPTKQQLRAKLVGTINAPVSGFVNVLAGTVRSLLNVFTAIAQKS